MKWKDIKDQLLKAGHFKWFEYNKIIKRNRETTPYIFEICYPITIEEGFKYDSYLFDLSKKYQGKLKDSLFSSIDGRFVRVLIYEFSRKEGGAYFKNDATKILPNNSIIREYINE